MSDAENLRQSAYRYSPLRDLMGQIALHLDASGIERAVYESRLLVSVALGWSAEKVWLEEDKIVGGLEYDSIMRVVQRRLAREPVAYLAETKEFWSMEYVVGAGCLIPRPDSECVVEMALDLLPPDNSDVAVLDLGTGSGCLLLSTLSERPQVWGLGTDISLTALGYAKRNASKFHLGDRTTFVQSNWGICLNYQFGLILCNPPYLSNIELEKLMVDVAFYEPELALKGGPDGLEYYRKIASQLPQLLADGGRICLEIGLGQGAQVKEIFQQFGFVQCDGRQDLSGIDRCLVFGR